VTESRDVDAGAAGEPEAQPVQRPSDSAMANREFRGIVGAQFTSECGDQIAAIALSYLVYTRSNNAFQAAATYAVTYAPWVLGAVVTSPLVDRFSRRRVMLICDLARVITVGLLAILVSFHGIPIGVLLLLVLISSCFSPPFGAARSSLLPDIFEAGPGYVGAVAIGRILQQVDQVFGFALGGVIVAAVSPRGALAIDSGTFLLSFVFTAVSVRERPAAVPGGRPSVRSLFTDIVPSMTQVLSSRTRRAMLLLSAAALLFLIAPEALAVAYARQHGHGAVAAGVLLAAQPLGVALGAWLFITFVPPRRQGRLLLPLAATGALLLALTSLVPPIWLACVIWMLAGVMQCFLVTTIAAYNVVTDRALRGRANGIAAATISISQGLGFLVWGAVGNWRGAAAGIAWAGVAGLVIMSLVRFSWPDAEIEAAWDKLDAAQHRSA
jgi:Na+/melibiose symporter-like transporter